MPGLEDAAFLTLATIYGIAFFSGIVHGTFGLGFPMVATPLLSLVVDLRSAILITLLPTVAVNILSIFQGGNWKSGIGQYWPLAVYGSIGSIAGAKLLIISDPGPFKLLLAVIILIYLNIQRIGHFKVEWIDNHPKTSMAAFGLLAGFLAGTVNVMVPVLIIYSLELGLAQATMVPIFNLCFLAGKVSQIGAFASAGLLDIPFLISTAPLAATGATALFFGIYLRQKFSAETYRHILKKLLFAIALILVLQYFLQ
ncbi:MAG: sulfite exporter TauE/SafE family protein [SAR324 cluster bacterium]|nr:sulfite exporter TauE/SafE family protein [SAR324 cluster bacterium]